MLKSTLPVRSSVKASASSQSFLGTVQVAWSDGEGQSTFDVVIQADRVLAALRKLEVEYGAGAVQRLCPIVNGMAVWPRSKELLQE
jgi:hypothetical protein